MFLSFVFDVPPSLPSAAWGGVSVCCHCSLHTPARFTEDLDDGQQCRSRSNICNFYKHCYKSYIICCDWYQNCAVRTAVCMFVICLKHCSFISRQSFFFLIWYIFWIYSETHLLHAMFTIKYFSFALWVPVSKWTWIKLSACKQHGYRREIALQWITPLSWLQGVVPTYCSGAWLLKSCR